MSIEQINQLDSNGLRQGLWREYYPNEQLKLEGHYQNDIKEGLWRYWYNNEHVGFMCYYIHGRTWGLCRHWMTNGDLWVDSYVEDGISQGERIYYGY